MNDSQNTQLFLKFLKQKSANLKNDIESLMHEVCKQVANNEDQAQQAFTGGEHQARHVTDYAPQTAHLDNPFRATGVSRAISPIRKQMQSSQKNYITRNYQINLNPNISCKKEDDQVNQDNSIAQINENKEIFKNIDIQNRKKIIKKSIKNKDFKQNKQKIFESNLLDHLRSIKDYDFDPLEMRQIFEKNKSSKYFAKRLNGKNIQKTFKNKDSNLETNLFIINHIQIKQCVELDIDIEKYNRLLNEINIKQNQKVDQ